MYIYIRFLILTGICFFVPIQQAFALVNVTTLPVIPVDKSNLNLFSTPIAYYQGQLYTVNVEPANSLNTGLNLKTVVRKSVAVDSQHWQWISNTIDNQTIEDKYHTQASIAIDKLGYLHIAYGMHNMPWQYVVSDQPSDIASFSFFGDAITMADKVSVKVFNKTPFPFIGSAAIPGNQVTYPAFFYDKNKGLYVTYRFAVKPKRAFKDRGFSGGIAYYDVSNKRWLPLGGDIQVNKEDADWVSNKTTENLTPFAYRNQWAVYLPRLAFDDDNTMHVSWLWREGGAGGDTTHPSYAYSPANDANFYTSQQGKYALPISEGSAEWVGKPNVDKFDAISEIEVDANFVYVLMHRQGKTRELLKLDRVAKKWKSSEDMPYSASIFKVDEEGGQWAFATGLRVLHRKTDKGSWQVVFKDDSADKYGYPKVLQVPGDKVFYIHTQNINQESVKIYKLEY